MKKMNNKGFSLVELIIVIAIMAILIGVLAPQYLKYVEKSKVSSDKDTLDSVYQACTTAAADPDLSQSVPANGVSFAANSMTGSGNDWTSEVLTTLGLSDSSSLALKLKSKSCKGQSVSVCVDSMGNFTVSCGGIKIPE